LDEWDVSQAEVSRMTGIPSPHLTDMKKSRRRCTPEYDLRLILVRVQVEANNPRPCADSFDLRVV